MSEQLPRNYHDIPNPDGVAAGRNNRDGGGDNSPAQVARLYKPQGAPPDEVPVSTLARFAGRMIDRATGRAYTAGELAASSAADISDSTAAGRSMITAADAAAQRLLIGATAATPDTLVLRGTQGQGSFVSSTEYALDAQATGTGGGANITSSTGVGADIFSNSGDHINIGEGKLIVSNAGLIQIGGADETYPALKRNGTGIEVRLADDDGEGTITASNLAYLATDQTFSGAKTFTAPIISTGTPTADTHVLNRTQVGMEAFFDLGRIYAPALLPLFTNSGTAGVSAAVGTGTWRFSLRSGTDNSGWAMARLLQGINTHPGFSGGGILFSRKIGVAMVCQIFRAAYTDVGNVYRLCVGASTAVAADGADPVTYRSFGIEVRHDGTNHVWRVYAHDGTDLTTSAWTNTGRTNSGVNALSVAILYLSVISDGAGNVTGYLGFNGSRTLATLTIAGGPTAAGASADSWVAVQSANSATGETDGIIYVQDYRVYNEE